MASAMGLIDFVLIGKIDDERRRTLLNQTMATFEATVSKELCNRFIYVDDCSTLALPYGFPHTKHNSLIEKNEKQLGVGGSKNRGVELHTQLGRGKYLYLFDGDVYFTDGWLEKLLEVYNYYRSTFKIIGGGIHPYLQPREGESEVLHTPEWGKTTGLTKVTSHDAISGWSWLLDYETWDKYGTLAANSLGTGQSEDWEYCQRIRNDGNLVGCIQPQVIAHCGLTNSEGKPIVGYDVSEQLAKSVAPQAILL